MATGANLQPGRGIQVSNITPQVDLRTGEAEAWAGAERTFDRLYEAAKPNLVRRAQERGIVEGTAIAEGRAEYTASRFSFGDVAAARTKAVETAYNARIRQDVDARLGDLRREFRYDPAGYEAKAQEVVSGFIQGAPPEFAVDVETYAQTKSRDGLAWVADQRSARDEQETVQAIGVRVGTLDDRLLALDSRPGGGQTPEYAEAGAERQALQNERMNNPLFLYSPEQRAADDDKLDIKLLGARVTRTAVGVYSDSGRGLPGTAAAMRMLNEEVLNGEAFKDLKPEARLSLYRESVIELRRFSDADAADRKVEEERERAERAARRETVGDYRLRILLGETTEAEVLADASLSDADKAGLVGSARAQARREAADARSVAALEAANARTTYAGFLDSARAGELPPWEVADALSAGLISPGQAATLRSANDRTLRPVIDDVMAPVRDAARRPGARSNREVLARAEENAVAWARLNPDAPLDLRLAAGKNIAERHVGGAGQGRPQTQANVQSGQAAALDALSAERARRAQNGRPMGPAEYNRRRTEIMHGS